MKKIAVILSILLIAGLNVEAQRRQARSSDAKSYKKSESAEKKSTKSSKPVAKINNRKSVNKKATAVSPKSKRSITRSAATRSNRSSNSRSVAVKSGDRSSRSVASRPDRSVVSERNRSASVRIGNTKGVIRGNNRSVRPSKRALSVVRTPHLNNLRIRHGYVDYSHRRYGYSSHHIMHFPMRIRYPFYQNYSFLLMHSYRPQVEYPWAIYESEGGDHTASIEGQVVDVDYNRRTNQYTLHFGRKSPYQSATVIIPEHLARFINHRDMRKLNRDYVSVYGRFTNYGNVPTIVLSSLDEIYVNEMSLRDFISY